MQRTISWENPTTYTDKSIIEPANLVKMIIHIYKDDTEVYNTLPGIITSFPIETNPGVRNDWALISELNGAFSPKSPPFSYMEPFLQPMNPVVLKIS